jgi:hypothetical protein
VGAVARARALDEHWDVQLAGAVAQRADVIAPARAIEVDRDQPTGLVNEQWVYARDLAPLEMATRLRI